MSSVKIAPAVSAPPIIHYLFVENRRLSVGHHVRGPTLWFGQQCGRAIYPMFMKLLILAVKGPRHGFRPERT